MPKLDLTITEGSLSAEDRNELARELGAALLRAERAPDTEYFRSITWAHIHELPAAAIQTPDGEAGPHAILDVTIPAGALSDRRKAELAESTSKLVLDATGWDGDAARRVWLIVHEVPDGNWGAGGQIIRFEALREAAKAERAKSEAKAEAPA